MLGDLVGSGVHRGAPLTFGMLGELPSFLAKMKGSSFIDL